MSALEVDIRSGRRRGSAPPRVRDVQRARDDAAALCSCTATSIPAPAGEVRVLRVAGEVDLLTIEVLQGALTSSLARGPTVLWPVSELPPQYPTAAAGVAAAIAEAESAGTAA